LFGESSQQPTCPQLRQMRRCTHGLPVFRHSSQPRALGCTFLMLSRWEHLLATFHSSSGDADARTFYFPVARFCGQRAARRLLIHSLYECSADKTGARDARFGERQLFHR